MCLYIYLCVLHVSYYVIQSNCLEAYCFDGPGSSVVIETGYGLDGLGIESGVGVGFFAHVHAGPETHPVSCAMGTGSFPGVKWPGRGADHPPPASAPVKQEESYTSAHPLGHFRPVTGQLYLYHIVLCDVK
jgi:hypothetical protein